MPVKGYPEPKGGGGAAYEQLCRAIDEENRQKRKNDKAQAKPRGRRRQHRWT